MSINLYRVSKVSWAVQSSEAKEAQAFDSVEGAADHLESIGVPDEEIDVALADMIAKGNTRAQFGIMNRCFTFSDNAKLNELLGTA